MWLYYYFPCRPIIMICLNTIRCALSLPPPLFNCITVDMLFNIVGRKIDGNYESQCHGLSLPMNWVWNKVRLPATGQSAHIIGGSMFTRPVSNSRQTLLNWDFRPQFNISQFVDATSNLLKPGVHTNDFAPIHGRRARIHIAPAEKA